MFLSCPTKTDAAKEKQLARDPDAPTHRSYVNLTMMLLFSLQLLSWRRPPSRAASCALVSWDGHQLLDAFVFELHPGKKPKPVLDGHCHCHCTGESEVGEVARPS